jgi:hypothetical protein
VPVTLTVKNVLFGIHGHPETLKTGKAIVTIAAFMTNSTPKIAMFELVRKLYGGITEASTVTPSDDMQTSEHTCRTLLTAL